MIWHNYPLPYLSNSLIGFDRIRSLGCAFLLDSGTDFPDDYFDIYAAQPLCIEMVPANASALDLSLFMDHLTSRLQPYRCDRVDHPLPGWFGLWSYDLGCLIENTQPLESDCDLPMAWMGFYPAIIVSDHRKQTTNLYYLDNFKAHAEALHLAFSRHNVSEPGKLGFSIDGTFQSNLTMDHYHECFDQIQQYIDQGDCYQINLAQKFSANFIGDSWIAYKLLREKASSPMGCYFEPGDWSVLSVSPERFIKIEGQSVLTKPIKGTIPRGDNPNHDKALIQALRTSTKDRAENLMIVDLLRNDLGRSCLIGSVQVPELFSIESFANVHHLVSSVTGVMRPDCHPFELMSAAFPGGSITGAPKHRAMEIIDELEPDTRSYYCGSAMYCDVSGRLDSNILIRTVLANEQTLNVWGGGGIVADSTCDKEYQETLDKVGNILKILS